MHDLLALNIAAAADMGATMTVLHPTERVPLIAPDGQNITICLLGKDSDTYIAADREARSKSLENMSEGGKLSPAELDHRHALAMARCTMSWHGIPMHWIDNGGSPEPAPCTPENALKLYENRGVKWLREQADKFLNDRGNVLNA